MRKVVVVGGGIAGVVAAAELSASSDVVLVEAAGRLGGKIATASFRDRPLDLGADAFIVRNRAALELCDELGLGAELVEPSTKSAAVFARGRLRPFPDGLAFGVPTRRLALWRSGTVGFAGTLRTLVDSVIRTPVVGDGDPSVADVFRRRLGARVVNTLIDPLVGGINASDVGALSFASAMPPIAERLAGARAVMPALRRTAGEPAASLDASSIFRGLDRGMASLVDALAQRLDDADVRLGVPVVGVRRRGAGFEVDTPAGAIAGDAVVVATPAYAAAEVLDAWPSLADELRAIPYASVATVTYAWPARDVPPALIGAPHSVTGLGSGVLVPRGARMLTTAATLTSQKWPRSANPGEVVVRASVGRHGDDRHCALDDGALVAAVAGELATVLGVEAPPLETLVARWPRSFPQYVRGHRDRFRRIEHLAGAAGIALVGAAYAGIGIPSCIARARAVARALAAEE